jgi:isopenicillin N synthase-like dioxygenase
MPAFLTALLLSSIFSLSAAQAVPEDALDIRIPVVDMQDFYNQEKREEFLDTLYQAMTKIGFFAVRNTGVNRYTIRHAYSESESFFKQDAAYKIQCQIMESKGQRGFVPGEVAKGAQSKDFKEFYHIGRELSKEERADFYLPENVWPKDAPAFKQSMLMLYNELDQYVHPLQEAIVAVINKHAKQKLPLNYFEDMMKGGDTLLRALYYPALRPEVMREMKTPLYWAAPHTDIDLLAILPYATSKGLQVEVQGQWLNVVVPEDALVVNGGDMLENLTNGLFVSARHRVLAQEPNKDRFSMVLFVHPIDSTDLTPLASCIEQTGGVRRYATGTRKEFLWERLLELNIAPGLLEPYSKTGHTERQMQYGRQSPQVVDMLIVNKLASPQVLESRRS